MTPAGTHHLERAIRLLGGRWELQLVYYLLDGPKRFSDLEKDVPKISQRMLSLNLRKLEEVGIISRKVLPEFPVKIEYQLTAKGLELRSVITTLYQWGEKLPDIKSLDEATDDAVNEDVFES